MIREVSLLYSQELAIYLSAKPAEPSKFPFIPNILPCMPKSSELSYTKHLPHMYCMYNVHLDLITLILYDEDLKAPYYAISPTTY